MDGKTIQLGTLTVTDFKVVDEIETHNFMGVTNIAGTLHHVLAVGITYDAEGTQLAVVDPYDRYGDILAFNEANLATVKIPGERGEFVLAIYPFAR